MLVLTAFIWGVAFVAQSVGMDYVGDVYKRQAYSSSKEVAEEWVEELKREFPGVPIEADPLALSIVCHIGPGAVAVACTRKIKVD